MGNVEKKRLVINGQRFFIHIVNSNLHGFRTYTKHT